jgi:hypothetical protein
MIDYESLSPVFEPLDAGALAQEPIAPERRGRKGRVLSQHPSAVRAREARARAKAGGGADRRARRKPSTAPRRGPKSLAPEIAAFLALVNGIVIVSPLGTRPVEAITDVNVEATRVGDELDAVEIAALAASIDAQCRRSPRFRKYVEGVLNAGSGGTLVTVIALIAARRAARHGIIPENIDAMGGLILAADVGALADMTPPRTEPDADPQTGEVAPDRGAEDHVDE